MKERALPKLNPSELRNGTEVPVGQTSDWVQDRLDGWLDEESPGVSHSRTERLGVAVTSLLRKGDGVLVKRRPRRTHKLPSQETHVDTSGNVSRKNFDSTHSLVGDRFMLKIEDSRTVQILELDKSGKWKERRVLHYPSLGPSRRIKFSPRVEAVLFKDAPLMMQSNPTILSDIREELSRGLYRLPTDEAQQQESQFAID